MLRLRRWTLALALTLAGCGDDGERSSSPTTVSVGGDERSETTIEPGHPEPADSPADTPPATPTPADAPTDAPSAPAPRLGPNGMCGGIAGFACPEDQWCDLEGDFPDAAGSCRSGGWCDGAADCEAQPLHHPACEGGWTCPDSACVWECG